MKIILASASERRHELMKRVVDEFEVVVSDFDENSVKFHGDFSKYVMELSRGKAENVAFKEGKDSIIVGCDTIVAHRGKVMGKPKDEKDAYNMLKALSGDVHQVFSGITIINTESHNILSDSVCTYVKFSEIDSEEILKYIATSEPMDKAGAYGIQGYGGIFVEEIKGCYYNVVGLPINRLKTMLKNFNYI